MLLSEVRNEHTSYAEWRPQKSNTLDAVKDRLRADYYSDAVVDALVDHFCPDGKFPLECSDWVAAFGKIFAAVQVHLTQRWFARKMLGGRAGDLVRRVRTEWMSSYMKRRMPKEMGVTHGTDSAIWFWGDGSNLNPAEQEIVRGSVREVFCRFLNHEEMRGFLWWNELNGKPELVRRLRADGMADNSADDLWDEGAALWDALGDASRGHE